MNSFINLLLLVVTLPTMLMSIFVGFDLPVEFLGVSGARIPYRFHVFLGLGMVLLIIGLWRVVRRWMGIRMTKQIKKFKWNQTISNSRKQRVVTYTLLESLVFLSLAFGYYYLTEDAWFPALAMLFLSVESLLFLLLNAKNNFRIGLTSKAILASDREIILIYLKGLRQVSISQQTVYFDYIENLQLSFPTDCIPKESRTEFFDLLKGQLDNNRVLFRLES
jgi:hypothetical protein